MKDLFKFFGLFLKIIYRTFQLSKLYNKNLKSVKQKRKIECDCGKKASIVKLYFNGKNSEYYCGECVSLEPINFNMMYEGNPAYYYIKFK